MALPRLQSLIGPLAGWELVRLARRGHVTRARLMVLYLVAIAFALVPIVWFPHTDIFSLFFGTPQVISIRDGAKFGNHFAMALLFALLLATTAIAPGYAAAAIAAEKDQRTLPLILASLLSDREIIYGKVVGGLGLVLAAAMGAMPIIAGVAIFGGIDIRFLISACVSVAISAILGTAIGAYAASIKPDLRSALIHAYAITALFLFSGFIIQCLVPSTYSVGSVVDRMADSVWFLALFAVSSIHLFVSVALLDVAAKHIRHGMRFKPSARVEPRLIEVLPLDETQENRVYLDDLVNTRRGDPVTETKSKPDEQPRWNEKDAYRYRDRPPINEDEPLVWKERYVTHHFGGPATGFDLAHFIVGSLAVIFLFIGITVIVGRPGGLRNFFPTSVRPMWSPTAGGRLMLTGATFAMGIYLVSAAAGLAGSISRERKRKTLDSLLVLPMPRSTLLKTKVLTSIERQRIWLMVAVPSLGLAYSADGGWCMGLAVVNLMLCGVAFVVGLGAWLSVRYENELQAFRFILPAVVAVIGAPVGLWHYLEWQALAWWPLIIALVALACLMGGMVAWRRACQELAKYG